MSRRKALCAISVHLEDVLSALVGGVIELLAQPLALVLALYGFEDRLRHNGLWVPLGERIHDGCRLLVRIDGSCIGVIILHGSIGIESRLC